MGRGGVSYELTDVEWDVVMQNMPLVLDRVKARRLGWHDAQDARQDGIFGLMRGVALCDAEKGRFSTIAVRHIDARIMRGRHKGAASIHVPEGIRYKPNHPDYPFAVAAMACGRLDAEDATGRPHAASLADDRTPDPAAETDREPALDALRAAIAELPDREREVVERRLKGELHREIAAAFGIGRQRVTTLEHRAHKRLRAALAEYA